MGADNAQGEKEDVVPAKKKEDLNKNDDLSEEDKQLQEELEMLVVRLEESNTELYKAALDSMCNLIKSSTTSMTSVPKPLKFMRPHYSRMKNVYVNITDTSTKRLCADIISVLGMTMTDEAESRYDTLNYRLSGWHEDVGAWGHEYVRHLTSQIVGTWQDKDFSDATGAQDEMIAEDSMDQRTQCLALVQKIVPYLMQHNAESEAIDLAIEIEQLGLLEQYTSKSNFQRVCLYLTSCVAYLPAPDNTKVLQCAASLYRTFEDFGNAIRCSLKLNDLVLTNDIFISADKSLTTPSSLCTNVQRQLGFLLGRQHIVFPDNNTFVLEDELSEMLWNTRLSEHFTTLARELDIMEPKHPEDIYKSHLETVRPTLNAPGTDTARINLAASYVNGLVNCCFGKEKLLIDAPDVSWLVKHKDMAKMSTVATLGWVLLWDVDTGLSMIDKYLYADEVHTRAGGLLGCGVINCGVKNECDPALALLGSYVESNEDALSRAAIIGLGVAYAGSSNPEALNKLTPMILDTNSARFQLACLAALSSGMVAVGSLNVDVTSTIIQTMLERPASQWNNSFSKFMALGLALTCLGRQEEVDVILASLEAVPEPLKSMSHMMCDFCAYAGSGNVLKVQNLLHILSERYEEEDKAAAANKAKDAEKEKSKETRRGGRGRTRRTAAADNATASTGSTTGAIAATKSSDSEGAGTSTQAVPMDTKATGEESPPDPNESTFQFHAHQGLAALGVAVISMGEEIGLDMAFRMFGNLLRFGELPIKRAVPLALAMCYVSNPQLKVLDTLSKFSHDPDPELSYNSILAMGIVGAGTNNARLAAMLRQLAVYHSRDSNNLFLVRIAQGLTHLGKGTLTLSPWHSDRFLARPVGVAALIALLVSCMDMRTTFMGRHDYLIFYLTPAIQPRLLMTFDESMKQLPVTVRVGQAVDVVGQAGRPKTITGFQTHTTPVLLSYGERAELATDEYLPVTNLPLEGFVILRKNPDYEETPS